MGSNCTHDIVDKECAVADGDCPVCLAADVEECGRRLKLLRKEIAWLEAQYVSDGRHIQAAETEIVRLRRILTALLACTHGDEGTCGCRAMAEALL